MPSISSCPTCHRDITLPNGVAPQRRLRCPLCDAQFLAEAVLAASTPSPPEVLLEDAEGAASSSLLTFGARLDEIVGEKRFWHSDAEASSPAAETAAESKSSEAPPDAIEASAVPTPSDAPLAAETGESAEPGGAGPWDAWRDLRSSAAGEERTIGEGSAAADGEAAAAEDGENDAGGEAIGEPAGSFDIAARPRPKQGSIGILGQFVGTVGGAIIGLALGYYVLLWIGGARADFLEIRDKLPRWLVPRERGENPATNDTSRRPPPLPGTAGDDAKGPLKRFAEPAGQSPSRRRNVVLAGGASGPAPGDVAADQAIGLASAPAPADDRPLGPSQFTGHTPDELAALLASIGGALGCEHCGGTGIVRRTMVSRDATPGPRPTEPSTPRRARCPNCDGKPSGKLTLELFDQLCELAEVATFTRVEPTQPDWERLRNEARRILVRIGTDHDKAQIAGRLAGPRLDDSARTSNGIVLVGTVHDAGEEGSLYRTRLVLFGRPLTITVMSFQAPTPPLAARDRVIVLGSIIDSPRDNLGGYEGDLSQVVWGGLALKLDDQ